MSDRIVVMRDGVFEQIGTPNEIYYRPRTSYVADFVGNANIVRENGKVYAVRSENVLLAGEPECRIDAVVEEKSFAGGQLRISFRLPDGQEIAASRYGIDYDISTGDHRKIGWKMEHAVEVVDNGI